MTETKMRTLPADVYDTLELAAEVFGGVGRDQMYTGRWSDKPESRLPCCAHGLANFAENKEFGGPGDCQDALFRAGIGGFENDMIFVDGEERIPFAEWCKRLHVVRGSDV